VAEGDGAVTALLQVRDLSKSFGAVTAVASVSLDVEEGSLHSIIGPNGAGKTTLFNCITGEVGAGAGRILYAGRDITGLPPHALPALGIARSFQRTSIFPTLTVAENVWVAAYARRPGGRFPFLVPADAVEGVGDAVGTALAEVGLADQAGRPADVLAHGDQRLLDFAIALAARPRLLLLDEPTAGLSRQDTQRVIRYIGTLKGRYTIVLIEHKMDVVMSLSDRISVMHFGRVLTEGTPAEIRGDPRVREAYLGRRARC
jgi:branched-chain amino acid transport system ATP-binding protein